MSTKKTRRSLKFAGLLLAAMVVATGCDMFQPHRGPLEQAGHDIDHAAQDVQHDVQHGSH